jgi:hypothetical protein
VDNVPVIVLSDIYLKINEINATLKECNGRL